MKRFPAFLFLFFVLPSLAAAGDEKQINEGLQENEGGTYTLPAGTHIITGQIVVPENTILRGEVSDTGELLSKIYLADDVKLGEHEYLVQVTGDNCKVLYVSFEGNSENQKYVPTKNGYSWGNGYHDFIGAKYINNLEVAYCDFYDNLGDGLRVEHCTNVVFHDNTASKGGHDVFYALFCDGIVGYNNTIYPRVNSALRAMSCSHLRYYDNYIEHLTGEDSAGPSIQIQHDSGIMQDIEVCNNVIVNSCGPGLWLVDKTGGNSEIWLHHNLFLNSGTNRGIYWVGGIISSGYNNARIENNVFDGSYLGAVNFWAYSSSWGTTATAYLDSNIFTGARPGIHSKKGGFGINNEIQKQQVITSNNCFWGNHADVKGCSVSDSDLFIDPKTHETPSGWIWTGSTWECDSVKPSNMGDISGNAYENNSITDEELEEYEFNNILDFLEMEFSDTANTTNTEVYPSITWQEKGKSRAWVDIVGWDNLAEREGVFYIPEGQQPIVKYDAENTASRPVSIKTGLTLTEENGTLTADLKVKAVYEVAKKSTKKINGISIPSIELVRKSKTSHYFDSEQVPKTYSPSVNTTAYLTILNNSLNPQTRVYVPESMDVMKVLFKVNDFEAVHYMHTATLNSTEKGIKYAQISVLDYWEGGNVSRLGNTLVLSGVVDPDELKIIQYDIYGKEIPITDYEIEVKTQDEKNLVHPVTFLFSGIVGFFLIATYKVSEVFL